MSVINLPHIAATNNFTLIEIGYGHGEGISTWRASVHGTGIGQHGCTFGYGESPEEALNQCIASALAQRVDKGMEAAIGEVEFLA